MQVDVVIHLESDEVGEVSWWAESDALAAFTAVANTLADLRDLVKEELAILGEEDGVEYIYGEEHLAAGPDEDAVLSASPNDTQPSEPSSALNLHTRQVLSTSVA